MPSGSTFFPATRLLCWLCACVLLSLPVSDLRAQEKPFANAVKVKKDKGEPLLNRLFKDKSSTKIEQSETREKKTVTSEEKQEPSLAKFFAKLKKSSSPKEESASTSSDAEKEDDESKAKTIAEYSKSKAEKIDFSATGPSFIESAPMLDEVDLDELEALARKKAEKVTKEEFLELPPAL